MSEPLPNIPVGDSDAENAEHASPDGPGPSMPPPTAVESLVNALLDAGPDVAEHVVRAAQELLLAAQVIVDAADTAVREQRDLHGGADKAGNDADTSSTGTGDDGAARRRHLDLAE